MNIQYKKLSEESIPLKYRKVIRRTYRLPNGRETDYEITGTDATMAIVAFTNEGQVILGEQFRPGPEKILLEIPGGVVDEGESPMETAKRELLEETGYTGEFQYVGAAYLSAYSSTKYHVCVAKNCRKVGEQLLGKSEFINVKLVTLDEFIKHLRSGELTDSIAGYKALDFLGIIKIA